MTDIAHGDVIRYSYLWWREHRKGEITGRKARPACVMVVVAGPQGHHMTLIFPITSQHPGTDDLAIEIPETEARRAKLRQPAWIIVSEFNIDDLDESFALDDIKPIGRLSSKFMSIVAAAAAKAIRNGGSKSVPRT